jgi:hypothetical protein
MGQFLSTLDVDYVDGNFWKLCEPLAYNVDDKEDIITVPKGFITDFASVPPVCNWFIPNSGKYDPAAVIHDWLYFKKQRPRAECDGIFCEAMKVLGVNAALAQTMYVALRAFGWIAWKWGKDKGNSQFK